MKKNESSPKMTGAIFLLIAVLILVIGLLVHWVQVGGMNETDIVQVTAGQLDILFTEYIAVGFLSALFLAFGIQQLKQKGGETVEVKEAAQ